MVQLICKNSYCNVRKQKMLLNPKEQHHACHFVYFPFSLFYDHLQLQEHFKSNKIAMNFLVFWKV